MPAAPGTVRSEAVRFLEADGNVAGGNAGVWTASIAVPADAILIDVIVHATALWTATTSATLIVGDTADDDGFFTGVNLKATDLLAGESISFALAGGKMGADVTQNDPTQASIAAGAIGQANRRKLATTRNLTCKVTTVGTPVTTRPGDTLVVFVYAYPNAMKATFTSS
jgi:hypothetical protein